MASEVLEFENRYFLSDFTAGHPWQIYPLIHHFCDELEVPEHIVLMEMDILEGKEALPTGNEDIAGFYFLDDEKNIQSQTESFTLYIFLIYFSLTRSIELYV